MSASVRSAGQIIGTPGGGLDDFKSWGKKDMNAGHAKAGQAGELRTARILDYHAKKPGGPTVLHDLAIPISGIRANIDHAVVAGNRVLIIDSKVWKPGRYWTFAGVSRRGFTRVDHVQKKTMQMAYDAITALLRQNGAEFHVLTPVVAVWPSSQKEDLKVNWLKVPGAVAIHADELEGRKCLGRLLDRKLVGQPNNTADSAVVQSLLGLVN